MANSLITGVSGLQSHQKMIEIVGNNLANLNTAGFKSRSALFSDVLYETIRGGSAGSEGSGGTNPVQVGTGSQLSATRINFSSGNLTSTGSPFDFALDGQGFFVVDTGAEQLFTRAGAFQVDRNGLLVDSGTGFPVQRFGTVGEPDGTNPSFQTSGNGDIRIPLGAGVPGKVTENVTFTGNLPADGDLPTTQTLLSEPWLAGGVAADASTVLNTLDFVTTPYQAGDTIEITGTNVDGSAISLSFAVDNTTTAGDLLTAINGELDGATATLTAAGRIDITADDAGESFLSLSLEDGAGNTGAATLDDFGFTVTQAGEYGAIVRGGSEVFDDRGGSHALQFEFRKELDGTWTLIASMDPSEGDIIDSEVRGLTFNSNGTFDMVAGTGLGDSNLTFQFDGQPEESTIQISFGNGSGQFGAGMTSFSGQASISSIQDGYPNGVLTSVQVDNTGVIQGIASNGLQFPLAQLAVASFRNPNGLESNGQNFFRGSLSSGEVQIGTGGSNGNGRIQSSQIEQSNVDIAVEFTRLIIAQRGFSANARTITVTNDILQELTNLIR